MFRSAFLPVATILVLSSPASALATAEGEERLVSLAAPDPEVSAAGQSRQEREHWQEASAAPANDASPETDRTDRVPLQPELTGPREYRFSTFAHQTRLVGWELAGLVAATTATRVSDVTKGGSKFHFKNEGWFGKDTDSLGMDKLHHAWKTYVFTDVLQSIVERRTGDRRGAALTGAILGFGVMAYAEVLDGFTARTGFSNEDMVVHAAGAGLSLLRNTVPGLREKVDFRMQVSPSVAGDRLRLNDQLAERKYLLAFQLSGFRRFERTSLRFAELHLGYYGRGFTEEERERGDPLRRRLFVGIGFNIQQLFSRRPESRIERWSKGVFDYVQPPFVSVHN